eukprot:TRINITY_DN7194_c0_g2_i1.p1 TRINITY_DN7194_c0_g2~~TRINITY_DN7194_c0_g2_i1.p1  ORF type:complete len:111 (-),score=0.66 TRINITY_DN7194_c0_g2_i1:187-519(-)
MRPRPAMLQLTLTLTPPLSLQTSSVARHTRSCGPIVQVARQVVGGHKAAKTGDVAATVQHRKTSSTSACANLKRGTSHDQVARHLAGGHKAAKTGDVVANPNPTSSPDEP